MAGQTKLIRMTSAAIRISFRKLGSRLSKQVGRFSRQALVSGRESITQDKHDQAYELITYSHDVVDLKMVDFLITEEGIHPQGTSASYLTEFYKTH